MVSTVTPLLWSQVWTALRGEGFRRLHCEFWKFGDCGFRTFGDCGVWAFGEIGDCGVSDIWRLCGGLTTIMRCLQGVATPQLGVRSWAGFHAAPSSAASCVPNSPHLSFRQRVAALEGRGVAAVESSMVGGLWGGRQGCRVLRSSGLGSPLVGHINFEKKPLGFLIDAVKNLAVCSQCRLNPSVGSFACLSSRTSSCGGGRGRGIGGRGAGGGGGGGGGGDGFEARASSDKASAVEGEQPEELPVGLSEDDVIILNVGGMSCDGCSASVKRILESQTQVSLANVNLATETAVVQISFDGQTQTDLATLKKEIGELLATHLTTCGFKSIVREVA